MIKTGKQLSDAAVNLAYNYKTVYALGCFGWPMNKGNQNRAVKAYPYNSEKERASRIYASDEKTFAFDCVGMIKALLWGWYGDPDKIYGGAVYASNGVQDKNANQMIALCKEVSTDFSEIQAGEVVWQDGHIGIYIGNGLAVECTPRWKDGVQVTAVHNMAKQPDFNGRTWTKHGKLPWLEYEQRAACYQISLPYLRHGSSGGFVEAMQLLLIAQGYSCGSSGADGIFGSNTDKAVRKFQNSRQIKADGIIGPDTLRALLEVNAS